MKPNNGLSGYGNHHQFSTWHPILDLLEFVVQVGLHQWMARCPAHPDRKPSLSVRVLENCILLYCFAGCVVEDILAALGLTMRDLFSSELTNTNGHRVSYKEVSPVPNEVKRAKLERLWNTSTPLNGQDKASIYLAARGLHLETYPDVLRYHSDLEYWEKGQRRPIGSFPTMLARVEHPRFGLVSVHRTYLRADGTGKAPVLEPKKLCSPVFEGATSGAAVKLFGTLEGEPLAVTEGIETALSVYVASGLPVWSCVNAIGLGRVLIPDAVREVIVCADHDKSGKTAAQELIPRLLNEGKTVRVATPPVPGTDWNDTLTNRG